MECIEAKRAKSPIALPSKPTSFQSEKHQKSSATGDSQHWNAISVESTTNALNERRQLAKQLLLEVEEHCGDEVLTKIATGVNSLHASYDRVIRDDLLMELKTQPELQRRLLQFLPPDPLT